MSWGISLLLRFPCDVLWFSINSFLLTCTRYWYRMNLQTFLSASCAYLLSELSKLSGGILPGNEQPPQIESAAADWIIHRWTGHVLAAGGWKEYRTVAAARSDWQRVKILESQKVVSLTRRPRQSLPVHFISRGGFDETSAISFAFATSLRCYPWTSVSINWLAPKNWNGMILITFSSAFYAGL